MGGLHSNNYRKLPPSQFVEPVKSITQTASQATTAMLATPGACGDAMDRSMAAAVRACMSLQSTGSKLLLSSLSRSREHICDLMSTYTHRLSLDVHALPPVIHIAGTKGKGSTAAMCESMLRASGLRTGLYTSPHLVDIRERFRVNGAPVTEPVFLEHFWHTWDTLHSAAAAAASRPRHPTDSILYSEGADAAPCPPFFHFLTLMAFRLFAHEGVDALVLEVGIGGRLDATNLIHRPVVCGVTTLDFDHMDVLGDTLPLIAAEKAGIFKPAVPAVTVIQRADALQTLVDTAHRVGAPLYLVQPDAVAARMPDASFPTLGLQGAFQQTNAALAIALTEIFMQHRQQRASEAVKQELPAALPASMPPTTYLRSEPIAPALLSGLAHARWSGRAQVVRVNPASRRVAAGGDAGSNLTLYIDGAHTEKSLQEATKWFSATALRPGASELRSCCRHRRVLVFYCGHEKDALQLLLPLSTLRFDAVYITSVPWTRPSPHAKPSTEEALAAFLTRKEKMGDTLAIDEVLTAAAQVGIIKEQLFSQPPCSSTATAGAEAQPAASKLQWQYTLRDLLTAVHSRHEFSITRRRMQAALGHSDVIDLPPCPPIHVIADIGDILQRLCDEACAAPDEAMDVLVTGSLYLVGGTLQAIGWSEDVTS